MTNDAAKFLEMLLSECDGGPDEHSWRKCRRCCAMHELESRAAFAVKLVTVAIESLKCSDTRMAKRARYLAKKKARCQEFHPEYAEQCRESAGHTGLHVDHDGNAW